MKPILIVFSIFIFILIACKKENNKNDQLFIQGRLLIYDPYIQNKLNQPLSGKTVLLAEDNGDSLNYLFSTTTDNDGFFVFNLSSGTADSKKYIIRYTENLSGYWYKDQKTVTKGNDSLQLTAKLDFDRQNGFVIYIRDSLGGKVPGASVAIYNSPVLAAINNPLGAMAVLPADSNGRVVKLNLQEGEYYLNAEKVLGAITYHRLIRTITIPNKGLLTPTPDSIMLLRKR